MLFVTMLFCTKWGNSLPLIFCPGFGAPFVFFLGGGCPNPRWLWPVPTTPPPRLKLILGLWERFFILLPPRRWVLGSWPPPLYLPYGKFASLLFLALIAAANFPGEGGGKAYSLCKMQTRNSDICTTWRHRYDEFGTTASLCRCCVRCAIVNLQLFDAVLCLFFFIGTCRFGVLSDLPEIDFIWGAQRRQGNSKHESETTIGKSHRLFFTGGFRFVLRLSSAALCAAQVKPISGVSLRTLKLTSTFPFFVPEPAFGRLAAIFFNNPPKGLSHTPLPDPTRYADDFPVGLSVTLTFWHCPSLWPLVRPFIPGVDLMLLLLQNPPGHFFYRFLFLKGRMGLSHWESNASLRKRWVFFLAPDQWHPPSASASRNILE